MTDKTLVLDTSTGRVKAVDNTALTPFDENRILCNEIFEALFDEDGNILLGD